MYVDVATYFFNFLAERFKHGHADLSHYQRRLRRLVLELIPPCISVMTLAAVTVLSLRQALGALRGAQPRKQDEPHVQIMFGFSALNLLLDVINVRCFARANQAMVISATTLASTETTPLRTRSDSDSVDSVVILGQHETNLNMCSAWTHVCADTLRSATVMVTAAVAYLFPDLLGAAHADSYGAIVVSVIILVSLVPFVQALYVTACQLVLTIRTKESFDDEKCGMTTSA
jgi:Co/Zn/Cd efflux system component